MEQGKIFKEGENSWYFYLNDTSYGMYSSEGDALDALNSLLNQLEDSSLPEDSSLLKP